LRADDPKTPARRVYQRDIAERAGVSISTVSRVLRDEWGISEGVQKRVLAAAEELGYERSKGTQAKQIQSVSLLTSLPMAPALDPFHGDVLHGVELACSERGVQLSYATFSNDAPNGDKILNRLRQNPVDGLLLLSLDDSDLIEEIRSMNVPMVMLNVDRPDATDDAFVPDNYQGARLAMRYLIDQGHERIMHITQLTRRTIQRRTEAYQDVLAEAGIPYDPRCVIEVEINAEATYKVMKQRLAQGDLDCTAVFCANDLSAMGFLRAAQEVGLRIPQDISVIGFDDIASAAFLSPPLTTIRIETGELATLALRRLIDRVAEPDLTPIRVSLACALVERQSVARLR
jgi:DNA-binding LacI/PurR family transcriptional regulator